MISRFLAFVLVFGLVLPTFYQIAIVVDFELNRDYISQVLCEMRDEPVNTCNGTCQLAKELKKTENSEQQQTPIERNQQYELSLYVYQDCGINNTAIPLLQQLRTPFFLHKYATHTFFGLLRPPQNIMEHG